MTKFKKGDRVRINEEAVYSSGYAYPYKDPALDAVVLHIDTFEYAEIKWDDNGEQIKISSKHLELIQTPPPASKIIVYSGGEFQLHETEEAAKKDIMCLLSVVPIEKIKVYRVTEEIIPTVTVTLWPANK